MWSYLNYLTCLAGVRTIPSNPEALGLHPAMRDSAALHLPNQIKNKVNLNSPEHISLPKDTTSKKRSTNEGFSYRRRT